MACTGLSGRSKPCRAEQPLGTRTCRPVPVSNSMNQSIFRFLAAAVTAASLLTPQAHAAVVLDGTRVVFPAHEREVTLHMANKGAEPALVQAWIDRGEIHSSPDGIDVPFVITPAVFRLDPTKGQTLRIIHTDGALATDRETIFWLNVLEIPPKDPNAADRNTLQVAVRTRIKLMYRPEGLAGNAQDAPAHVRWEVVRDGRTNALKAVNPTPWVVNLADMKLEAAGRTQDVGGGFVRPFDSQLFPLKDATGTTGATQVNYTAISDWGGALDGSSPLGSRP